LIRKIQENSIKMIDSYVYVIIALLPLTAIMVVIQVNPYQALVIRAILGAVAALVYAVLGAADVALTEALVGTMLAITLYVVAVRSSLVMRLGILTEAEAEQESYFKELIARFKTVINQHYLRLELIEYPNSQALEQALMTKEVHATCQKQEPIAADNEGIYHTAIRVHRLFEIMENELNSTETTLSYVQVSNQEEKH
jgi:putative multicomponent Na+:H+ antiporter subunit B